MTCVRPAGATSSLVPIQKGVVQGAYEAQYNDVELYISDERPPQPRKITIRSSFVDRHVEQIVLSEYLKSTALPEFLLTINLGDLPFIFLFDQQILHLSFLFYFFNNFYPFNSCQKSYAS
jgi:hypothetical protein